MAACQSFPLVHAQEQLLQPCPGPAGGSRTALCRTSSPAVPAPASPAPAAVELPLPAGTAPELLRLVAEGARDRDDRRLASIMRRPPDSFHTSKKASPMFLLAAPPCRATWEGHRGEEGWGAEGRTRHCSIPAGSPPAGLAAAGGRGGPRITPGAHSTPAALSPARPRPRPEPHLLVHDLRDAVDKLHHLLLQHLGGVCKVCGGVRGEGASGRGRGSGRRAQGARSSRRAACPSAAAQGARDGLSHYHPNYPCHALLCPALPSPAQSMTSASDASPVKERMSQKPKMAATLRPGTMGFRSPPDRMLSAITSAPASPKPTCAGWGGVGVGGPRLRGQWPGWRHRGGRKLQKPVVLTCACAPVSHRRQGQQPLQPLLSGPWSAVKRRSTACTRAPAAAPHRQQRTDLVDAALQHLRLQSLDRLGPADAGPPAAAQAAGAPRAARPSVRPHAAALARGRQDAAAGAAGAAALAGQLGQGVLGNLAQLRHRRGEGRGISSM